MRTRSDEESLGHSSNNASRGSVVLSFSAVTEMDAGSIAVSRAAAAAVVTQLSRSASTISPAGSWKNSQLGEIS